MHLSHETWLVLLGAILGFGAARLNALLDRFFAKRSANAARLAKFRLLLTPSPDVWVLENFGDADAEHVEVIGPAENEWTRMRPFKPQDIAADGKVSLHIHFDSVKLDSRGVDVPTIEVRWLHCGQQKKRTLALLG